jgi:hypothetical protein
MTRFWRLISLAAALALLAPVSLPIAPAQAVAQTTHAFLCVPPGVAQASGPRRAINPTTTPAPSYNLNADGCAVIAAADISYFLSQGYYYGPNTFSMQQTAITATLTATTSNLFLPAYAVIHYIVLSETAGNAITGGFDIGDSSSATTFASAVSLGANDNVVVADSALTRIPAASGVPTSDQILIKCHTSCNSGSINVTIAYGYDW